MFSEIAFLSVLEKMRQQKTDGISFYVGGNCFTDRLSFVLVRKLVIIWGNPKCYSVKIFHWMFFTRGSSSCGREFIWSGFQWLPPFSTYFTVVLHYNWNLQILSFSQSQKEDSLGWNSFHLLFVLSYFNKYIHLCLYLCLLSIDIFTSISPSICHSIYLWVKIKSLRFEMDLKKIAYLIKLLFVYENF